MKDIPGMISESIFYIQTGIWRIRLKDISSGKRLFVKNLRVFLIAVMEFIEDKCPLRSSALTFYSLLAIVPVVAMAFAIAKGFGVQNLLENELLEQFAGQEEVIMRVMEYARTLLENTKGGLLAGIGAAILLWAVIKVLNNIEQSFNDIWAIRQPRTIGRKFSDYLSIMLVSPLLLIMSGSATVLIVTQVTLITEKISFLGILSPVITFLLNLLPYCLIWALFAFVYVFMPNTKVSIGSSLIGGIIAGTAFKILQWAYIYFQIGVSRYNAIYGSFAALPLFLIWLELSWLIVLFGAELSFAHQNVDEYEFEPDSKKISDAFKRLLSLGVVHLLVKNFMKGEKPLTAQQISNTVDMPIRIVRMMLDNLVASGIIITTPTDGLKDIAYQPGKDINGITISSVIEAMDKNGTNKLPIAQTQEFNILSKSVSAFYDEIRRSRSNIYLKDI